MSPYLEAQAIEGMGICCGAALAWAVDEGENISKRVLGKYKDFVAFGQYMVCAVLL